VKKRSGCENELLLCGKERELKVVQCSAVQWNLQMQYDPGPGCVVIAVDSANVAHPPL
jgi:hypothetical protein